MALTAAGAYALGSGIAAAAGTANTIISGVNASNLNSKNRSWQEKIMQQQRDWSLEDWERENDVSAWYNRVSNAGLNPPLIAGQANLSQPSSSVHSPQGTPPNPYQHSMQFDASSFNNAANMLLQGQQVEAQSKVANAQSVSTIINAAIEAYKIGGKDAFDSVVDKFAPYLSGSNPEMGIIYKRAMSEIYNTDMDSLNKELSYELSKKYSSEQIMTGIEATNQQIAESVGRMNTMRVTNEIALKKLGYELGVLAAQKFNLISEGGKAQADAKTINAVRNYVKRSYAAKAQLDENQEYSSNVYRENFENAAGWLTSKEGKALRGLDEKRNLDYKTDKVFDGINRAFDVMGKISGPVKDFSVGGYFLNK